MAVDIALVLDEQIGSDWVKISRQYTRADVRNEPSTHLPHNLLAVPMTFVRRDFRSGVGKEFGMLRKYRIRQGKASGLWRNRCSRRRVDQQVVNSDVYTKSRLSRSCHLPPWMTFVALRR